MRLDPSKIHDVDPFDEDLRKNWFAVSADLATRDPFYVLLGDEHIVVVSRHAHQTEVMLDEEERFTVVKPRTPEAQRYDLFMGLPVLSAIAGPAHDRLRRLMQPAFGRNGIGVGSNVMEETVNDLLDEIEAKGGQFDATADFCRKLIATILYDRMLGLDDETKPIFARMGRAMRTGVGVGGYSDEYVAAFNEALAASKRILQERTSHPTDDFISRMITGRQEGDAFTDHEVIGNIFGLLAGGLDTTTTTTSAALLMKCRNQDQFAQIVEEPELVDSAVEETLRLHPAGIFTNPRYALVDTEIGGTPIYRGMTVLLFVSAGNLDPEKYPDPLSFDIRRNPRHILTFGRGTHFCVGAPIARKAAHAALRVLMERFPNFTLTDPAYQPNYAGVRGELAPGSMPMQLEP
jgi:cytochrome P450